MSSATNWLAATGSLVALSYYYTGLSKVAFDKTSPPAYRPSYTRNGTLALMVGAITWPFGAYINLELAWYVVNFIATSVYLALGTIALANVNVPTWAFLLFVCSPIIPGFSYIANFFRAATAAAIWKIFARPLKLKIPKSIVLKDR